MNNSKRKATKTPKPERSVMTRKIIRQMLKNKQGNNKIADMWKQFQINRYGEDKAKELRLESKY